MSTIDDLGNKVQRLRDQLRDAQQKYDAARIAEHPVKVGMRFVNKRSNHAGEVTRITVRYDRILPILTYFKKDGTLGQRTAEMRWPEDWERQP